MTCDTESSSIDSVGPATADTLKQEALRSKSRYYSITLIFLGLINCNQAMDTLDDRLAKRGKASSTKEATFTGLQQVASVLGTIDRVSAIDRPPHIASHMPPLPPGYTYKHTLASSHCQTVVIS
jgi:hypothetical protein